MVKDFLEVMTKQSGSSGYENEVAAVVSKEFEKHCSECTTDGHNNVVGVMKAEKCPWQVPKVLICAHMDEVSLVVSEVEKNGFLKVLSIGGVDARLFPGMEVIVHGKKDIRGVIGARPENDLDTAIMPLTDIYVDTGLNDATEIVSPGDTVTYDSELCSLKNTFVMGKAMDDRAGVAMLTATMEELEKLHFFADVYFAATVQEELGTKGASMVAYKVHPDIGIAIDVTHGTSPDATGVPMDKGVSVTVGPNIHPTLVEKLMKTADENNIGYSVEVNPRPTGTDARAIQISRDGVPTVLLSIPLRYMHTPNEVIDLNTVTSAAKLIALFISSLKEDWQQWTNY